MVALHVVTLSVRVQIPLVTPKQFISKVMKTSYHENGWTLIVDENINELSRDDIHEVCRLVLKNTVVVFKNQQLAEQEELAFCKTIGQVMPTLSKWTTDVSLSNGILRVSGGKNERGAPGVFSHKDPIDWHSDFPSMKLRKPLVWLYGAKGTLGSRTSWLNTHLAYNDLSNQLKEKIKDVRIICGFKQGRFSPSSYFTEHVNYNNPIQMLRTNQEGLSGIFFPWLQTFGFEGYSEEEFKSLEKEILDHMVQEKYMYHHDWQDGDAVISDEWLSLHKRWAFEGIENRTIHRINFNHYEVYGSVAEHGLLHRS